MSGRSWPLWTSLVLASFLGHGCEPEGPRVLSVEPFETAEVRLDQPWVVVFDQALEPGSVGPETFRVRDGDGRVVDGDLVVERERISFHPRLPCRPDLSDAALLPGAQYLLELPGRPALAAVRDVAGRRLVRGLRHPLRTVAAQESPFLEPGPRPPATLSFARSGFADERRREIVVRFDAPLDPRSVVSLRAWLFGPWDSPDLEWSRRLELSPPLPLVLGENRFDGAELRGSLPDSLPIELDPRVHTLRLVLDLGGLRGLDGRAVVGGAEASRTELALSLGPG